MRAYSRADATCRKISDGSSTSESGRHAKPDNVHIWSAVGNSNPALPTN